MHWLTGIRVKKKEHVDVETMKIRHGSWQHDVVDDDNDNDKRLVNWYKYKFTVPLLRWWVLAGYKRISQRRFRYVGTIYMVRIYYDSS